jgi:hypothetical protein
LQNNNKQNGTVQGIEHRELKASKNIFIAPCSVKNARKTQSIPVLFALQDTKI